LPCPQELLNLIPPILQDVTWLNFSVHYFFRGTGVKPALVPHSPSLVVDG
jgi:hypothetical protein